jgi:hypothetical protein
VVAFVILRAILLDERPRAGGRGRSDLLADLGPDEDNAIESGEVEPVMTPRAGYGSTERLRNV